jgi:Tat protein translocase TatB subunit
MNILGMGPLEILLIVVLALIVFGPAKLPEIMAQVGRAIAEFRRTTSVLSDEFNRTIQAELQETRSVLDDTRSAVTGVHTSINSALSGVTAPALTTPAPTLTTPAPTLSTPPANGTNGSVAPETKPPLADTAQWSWETAAPAPTKPPVEVTSAELTSETATQTAENTGPAPDQPLKIPRKPIRRDDLLPPY